MGTRTKIWIFVLVRAAMIAMFVVWDRRLIKECEYRPVKYDCGCGVLGASLIGTWVTCGSGEVKGAPYVLFISFHSPDGGGTVTLKSAERRDADQRDRVCAEMWERTDSLDPDTRGGYTAYFSREGLDLEYVRYALSVQLVVDKGEKTESRDVELLFEQNYREYTSSGFWSALMGV